jgi:hypothetical protein
VINELIEIRLGAPGAFAPPPKLALPAGVGSAANSSSTFLWHYGIRQGPQKPADVRGARSLPQSAAGPPLVSIMSGLLFA